MSSLFHPSIDDFESEEAYQDWLEKEPIEYDPEPSNISSEFTEQIIKRNKEHYLKSLKELAKGLDSLHKNLTRVDTWKK